MKQRHERNYAATLQARFLPVPGGTGKRGQWATLNARKEEKRQLQAFIWDQAPRSETPGGDIRWFVGSAVQYEPYGPTLETTQFEFNPNPSV